MVEVIVGCPLKPGRRRELEHPIVVCDSPQVPLIANIMNAGIVALIFATNLRGAITRSVITDQDLEVSKGLRQEVVEQFWQELLSIEHRDSNRELRHRARVPCFDPRRVCRTQRPGSTSACAVPRCD